MVLGVHSFTALQWLELLGILFTVGIGIVLTVAYLKSRVRKEADVERDRLLALRADRITELESKVENLTTEVARISGMFEALQLLKASEIASETARLLRDSGLSIKAGVAGQ